jgi:hypothetical protein
VRFAILASKEARAMHNPPTLTALPFSGILPLPTSIGRTRV